MTDLIARYDEAVARYPTQAVDGGFSYIERPGDGPTLVMLHSTIGTPHIFFPLFDDLPDVYRLVSFALPDLLQIDDFAKRFETSCKELGIAHCVILGSGIGAYLAQFIADQPMVKGVILCCAMASLSHIGVMPDSRIEVMEACDQATIFRDMYQPMVADWPRQTRMLADINDLVLTRILDRTPAPIFMDRTRFVSHNRKAPIMPVPQSAILIVASDDDPITNPAAQQELAARYSQAKKITFKDCGQYPFLIHEAAFAEAVDAMMAGLGA